MRAEVAATQFSCGVLGCESAPCVGNFNTATYLPANH